MPISKSAIKRMRTDKKKHERNIMIKSRLKTLFKAYTHTLAERDIEKARVEAKTLYKEYSKAASKNVIPKPTANRKKGRISRALHKLVTTQSDKK